MTKIAVEQFAILADSIPDGDTISLTTSLGFRCAINAGMLSCVFIIEYAAGDDKPLIKLAMSCESKIKPGDWENLVKDNSVTIPKSLQEFLAAQTIGASRGVLYCKTENTPFNRMIQPPINATELIEGDIEFKHK